MRKKRQTKAQRAEAAREAEAQNARIRAQREESERAVKAREEEERKTREAKEEEERAAERIKQSIAEDERREKVAREKKEREELKKEIAQLDLELAALDKAEYTTTFEWNLAIIDLIAKPSDAHHAKATYLLEKLNELHEIIAKRKAERTVLESRESKIGLGYDGLMSWIVALAASGSAYWMARQWGSGRPAPEPSR